MNRILFHVFVLALGCLVQVGSLAFGSGLLIPVEPEVPPLALVNHHVNVTLEDQVAVTEVEQTFRNHTDRELEATYVFPVPKGASVRQFAMWVDGQRVQGELLKAERAMAIYTSIVRQTKNPALLDYVDSDMLRLKIFPVPPNGDQKVTISFTAVAEKEHDLVEYVYPLATDRMAPSTLQDFRIHVTLNTQHTIANIYSPTHDVNVVQDGDHEAVITFEQSGAELNRDFRLFYATSGQDIGLTVLQHRPISDEDGYAMLLVSPRTELPKEQRVPRDIVFVIDTSGSMGANNKMDQAKTALRQCLGKMSRTDRFAIMNFATTVNRYHENLVPANEEQIQRGQDWVSNLYSGGGTAMHKALTSALTMRDADSDRMFTVVFFTDGHPTIGEMNTDKILTNVMDRNTQNTRVFTFGLGHDLNAAFLDQVAEKTRALSSYVRPDQDLERTVSSFFDKIQHPVLANLELIVEGDARLVEIYPPELPDVFHGDQMVVLARSQGSGKGSIVLNGKLGREKKQYTYELDVTKKPDGKPFVEELWARRKVGYLLDQIRLAGEEKELVDEVIRLAMNYGITTPYTSYLIMPDISPEVASAYGAGVFKQPTVDTIPSALAGGRLNARKEDRRDSVESFAKRVQRRAGDLAKNRGSYQEDAFEAIEELAEAETVRGRGATRLARSEAVQDRYKQARELKGALDLAQQNYRSGRLRENQINKQGVDLSVSTNALKWQNRLNPTAIRRVAGRNCIEFGGVWIDQDFSSKTPTCSVKAQSDAYFKILERHPEVRDVYKLGNHLVWITPNGTGLVIDTTDGKDELSDQEIDLLFTKS